MDNSTKFHNVLRVLVAVVAFASLSVASAQGFVDNPALQKSFNKKLNSAPAVFRENSGQWEEAILFRTQVGNTNIHFTKKGLSFGLRKVHEIKRDLASSDNMNGPGHENAKFEFLIWDLNYVNANENTTWTKKEGVKSYTNYYKGADGGDNPQINVVDYKNITNYNVYDNIDVDYYVSNEKLKYDYILHPGSDIDDIELQFDGVEDLSIDGEGNLIINTQWGAYTKTIPYSYQIIDGQEIEVKVNFSLAEDKMTYGFEVEGEYNKEFDLVIDPIYIDWGSYFYGEKSKTSTWSYSYIRDVDVDANDYVYLCGWTTDHFPSKPGWYDTTLNGIYDGFLCKMKPDGSDIEWFSYIGGSGWEWFFSLAVTDDGKVFGTGRTQSTDFPTTKGAYQTKITNPGTGWFYPSFVFGMKSDGTALIYSSYLHFGKYSWSSWEGQPIEVNDKGEVYLGMSYEKGSTIQIKNYILPAAYYNTVASGRIGLLIKMNASGSDVLKSTLHGGSGNDEILGLYLDKDENIFLAGHTSSSNLWVTMGVAGFGKNYYGGTSDGFVAKIDSSFSKYLVAKYIGGASADKIYAVYGSDDGIYMLMQTNSTSVIGFPNSQGGNTDAAVAKMWPDGVKADWVTFVGGSQYEWPRGITANIKEEAIFVGQTYSNDFPTTNDALKKDAGGNGWSYNAFLTKLDYDGKVSYSTYIGGDAVDWLWGVSTKRVGCVSHIVMGGYSSSNNFPVTEGSWRDTVRNQGNGFWYGGAVLKMRDTLKVAEIDLGGSSTECNFVYSRLDAGNVGASYIWSTGDTTRRITAEDTGTYWVKATYGCGTETDTIHINLEHTAKRVLLKDTVYCGAILDTLDAMNDTIPHISYKWSTGETTRTIEVNQPGTYYVDLNTKNCGLIRDDIVIGLKDFPEIDLPGDSTFCKSFSMELDAGNENKEMEYLWSTLDTTQKITAIDTGTYTVIVYGYCGADTASVRFEFDSIPTFTLPEDSTFCDKVDYLVSSGDYSKNTKISYSSNLIGTEQNDDKSFLLKDTGTYWVELDNLCGSHREQIRIDKILSPSLNLNERDTMCNTEVLLITVGKENNEEKYEWTPGGSTLSNYLVSTAGIYKVKISNKCASVEDSMDVAYLLSPEVSLGRDSLFCDVVNYTLDAGNLDREETYLWNDGGTSQSIGINGEGEHWVKVSNKCGSDSDTIVFRFLETPVVDLGADKAYCGTSFEPFDLDAGNAGKQATYEWSTNASTQKITAALAGTYSVKVSNECGEANSSMNVVLTPYPNVDLGIDTAFCGYFSYRLDAGNPGSTYSWIPSGDNTQHVELTEYGLHKVIVNNNNCITEDEVYIDQKCNTLFFMPNSFTPDGNGLNEVLKPTMHHVFEMNFTVFNRWGEMIFQTNDLESGWDGKFNGVDCPQGVYMWNISFLGDDKRENLHGEVYLLR